MMENQSQFDEIIEKSIEVLKPLKKYSEDFVYQHLELFLQKKLADAFIKVLKFGDKVYQNIDAMVKLEFLFQKKYFDESIVNKLKTAVERFLSNEELALSKPAEGEESDVLNKYVFADQRKHEVPNEPNNAIEKKLLTSLFDYFRKNQQFDLESYEILSNIVKNNKYNTFFRKPQGQFIYRGMSVSEEYLESCFNDSFDHSDEGNLNLNFKFKPYKNHYVSSWTSDLQVAQFFCSMKRTETNNYGIILTARVSDNKNVLLDCFNLTKLHLSIYNESEILAFDEIQCLHINWTKKIYVKKDSDY